MLYVKIIIPNFNEKIKPILGSAKKRPIKIEFKKIEFL